jgi:hypothetical protein
MVALKHIITVGFSVLICSPVFAIEGAQKPQSPHSPHSWMILHRGQRAYLSGRVYLSGHFVHPAVVCSSVRAFDDALAARDGCKLFEGSAIVTIVNWKHIANSIVAAIDLNGQTKFASIGYLVPVIPAGTELVIVRKPFCEPGTIPQRVTLIMQHPPSRRLDLVVKLSGEKNTLRLNHEDVALPDCTPIVVWDASMDAAWQSLRR